MGSGQGIVGGKEDSHACPEQYGRNGGDEGVDRVRNEYDAQRKKGVCHTE